MPRPDVPGADAPGANASRAATPAGPLPTVLACGLATLDVVQTVDHVPGPNEKLVASGLDVASGGPAANAAVTCALLGVPARLVTRIGGGALGTAVTADLVAAGVDVVDLAPADARPPVSTVLVTRATGERAVVSVNATLGPDVSADMPGGSPDARPAVPLPAHLWVGVGVVLVDGHHRDLAVAVAAEARRRGIPVVLDGGSWKPGLEHLLAHVDVAVVSADFAVPDAAAVPDDAAAVPERAPVPECVPAPEHAPAPAAPDPLAAVLRLGPTVAARSAGAAPIEVAATDGARALVPVAPVEVVDTLGAGDVLHGALAARLAARAPAPVPPPDMPDVVAALTWAAGVASASCAAPGARGWARDATLAARLRAELAGPA